MPALWPHQSITKNTSEIYRGKSRDAYSNGRCAIRSRILQRLVCMAHLDGDELDTLWDYADPAGSEQRFREALRTAEGTVADELSTQLARACGLQDRFKQAHALLDLIQSDDPVVQQRMLLERGRLHNAAGDPVTARPLFQQAYVMASDPYLTLDALHMLAIVNPSNARYWYGLGMRMITESANPRLQRWEGSLRTNWAWTLLDNSIGEEALQEFIAAEEWFAEHGTAQQTHVARWSVAHVLRLTGRNDEAREILLYLRANDDPDSFVDEELALLGE